MYIHRYIPCTKAQEGAMCVSVCVCAAAVAAAAGPPD